MVVRYWTRCLLQSLPLLVATQNHVVGILHCNFHPLMYRELGSWGKTVDIGSIRPPSGMFPYWLYAHILYYREALISGVRQRFRSTALGTSGAGK